MKLRIVFLLLLILSAFDVFGQELTVKKMEMVPMDLSASTQPRNDRNDNPCALVKVLMVDDISRVEGNVIGDVEDRGTEKWVYLSAGTKMMRIIPKNHLPLMIMFGDYGINKVEGKVTYELILSSASSIVDSDDGKSYLVINVQPETADVEVDGKSQEVKGGSAKVRLSHGSHSYTVSAFGYAKKHGTVVLGNEKKQISVSLESAMATLCVSCATEGASIYINDELQGRTPWKGILVSGDYLVEARKEGYRNTKKSISLKDRELQTVNLPPLQMISGTIDVNYDPVGTEVWLDGKKLGTSPDIFRSIAVGSHQLKLISSGYQDKLLQVIVEEGKTQTLTGTLQRVETQVSKPVEPVSNKVSQSSTSAYNNIDMDWQEAQSADDSGFITVTGTVVDRHSDPIIGSTIFVVGTNTGTVSDYNGQFTIKVPVQGKTKLRFGFVGMKTKYVTIDKIKNPVLKVVMR